MLVCLYVPVSSFGLDIQNQNGGLCESSAVDFLRTICAIFTVTVPLCILTNSMHRFGFLHPRLLQLFLFIHSFIYFDNSCSERYRLYPSAWHTCVWWLVILNTASHSCSAVCISSLKKEHLTSLACFKHWLLLLLCQELQVDCAFFKGICLLFVVHWCATVHSNLLWSLWQSCDPCDNLRWNVYSFIFFLSFTLLNFLHVL